MNTKQLSKYTKNDIFFFQKRKTQNKKKNVNKMTIARACNPAL